MTAQRLAPISIRAGLRSVGFVVLVVVGAVLLVPRQSYDAAKEIDYSAELRDARAGAPYHVLAPVGLHAGWRPTSVRYGQTDGITMWHLGYISPAGEYIGIEQSNGPAGAWISQQTHGGRPEGVLVIDQRHWTMRYQPERKLRSLAITWDGVTVVVAGVASYQTLTEFAGALQ